MTKQEVQKYFDLLWAVHLLYDYARDHIDQGWADQILELHNIIVEDYQFTDPIDTKAS